MTPEQFIQGTAWEAGKITLSDPLDGKSWTFADKTMLAANKTLHGKMVEVITRE